MDGQTNSPVFIIGCERSGTTLLRAMLNSHPNIAIPYEASSFTGMTPVANPWNHVWNRKEIEDVLEFILTQTKVRYWNLELQEIIEKANFGMRVTYPEILTAVYRAHALKEGKNRWGDKTPVNAFDLPRIIKAFPTAKFIHIVRDGRDVYLSWAKAEWARHDLKKAARKWKGWVWSAYRLAEKLGLSRYMVVRYETLVQNPRTELQKICMFLDEQFSENMLEYYKKQDLIPEKDRSFHQLLSKPPEPSRMLAWRKKLTQAESEEFERIAGSILLRYGYEVSQSMRSKARFALAIQRVKDLTVPEWLRTLRAKRSEKVSVLKGVS